jgi:hypothetical protein
MEKPRQSRTRIRETRWDDPLGCQLREHFETQEADSLLRSLHGSFVDMALAGPPTGGGGARRPADAGMTDHVLYRQGIHREVRRALVALGPQDSTRAQEHRAVLWVAYGPHLYHPQVYARFSGLGRTCGVVLFSPRARAAFEQEVARRTADGKERTEQFARQGLGEWLRAGAPESVVTTAIDDGKERLRDARNAIRPFLATPEPACVAVSARAQLPRLPALELRPRMVLA